MRTLIYKRTHSGDPDPKTGIFGNRDCMGSVRAWTFDAVIGIGGVGQEPQNHRIAGKLTWIGIGPLVVDQNGRGPQLAFRHFWYRGEEGPILRTNFPALAHRMYHGNARVLLYPPQSSAHRDSESADLDRDAREILRLAKDAAPSRGMVDRGKSSGKSSARVCR